MALVCWPRFGGLSLVHCVQWPVTGAWSVSGGKSLPGCFLWPIYGGLCLVGYGGLCLIACTCVRWSMTVGLSLVALIRLDETGGLSLDSGRLCLVACVLWIGSGSLRLVAWGWWFVSGGRVLVDCVWWPTSGGLNLVAFV